VHKFVTLPPCADQKWWKEALGALQCTVSNSQGLDCCYLVAIFNKNWILWLYTLCTVGFSYAKRERNHCTVSNGLFLWVNLCPAMDEWIIIELVKLVWKLFKVCTQVTYAHHYNSAVFEWARCVVIKVQVHCKWLWYMLKDISWFFKTAVHHWRFFL